MDDDDSYAKDEDTNRIRMEGWGHTRIRVKIVRGAEEQHEDENDDDS